MGIFDDWWRETAARQHPDSLFNQVFGGSAADQPYVRDIPKDTPRSTRNPLGLDPSFLAAQNQSRDNFLIEQERQQEIAREARKDLTANTDKIQDLFDTRLQGILDSIPRNPFSDQEAAALRGDAYSNINAQVNRLSQNIGNQRADRGFSSGGTQAISSASELGMGEISARNKANLDILDEQRRANTAQGNFIANLEAGMTTAEAAQLAGLYKTDAGLGLAQAGLMDPTYLANLTQDIFSAQFGKDQADEMKATIDRLIEEGRVDEATQFFRDFLPAILTQRGYEGLGIFASAL